MRARPDFDIWSSVRVALRKDTIHAEIFVTPSGVTPLRPFGCRQVKATCRLLLADHSALFHSLARLLSAGYYLHRGEPLGPPLL
ncbi:hypothetical protein VDGE_30119 [Verticillium dahliae]|uniref:Uncharacterized protein n=1 Tax=Verticillium dahliae TaxID=27337 RepID=A0A444S895_VERDA|nr:hypothetical protein VDGE_30119 [Verticillium dahliae]